MTVAFPPDRSEATPIAASTGLGAPRIRDRRVRRSASSLLRPTTASAEAGADRAAGSAREPRAGGGAGPLARRRRDAGPGARRGPAAARLYRACPGRCALLGPLPTAVVADRRAGAGAGGGRGGDRADRAGAVCAPVSAPAPTRSTSTRCCGCSRRRCCSAMRSALAALEPESRGSRALPVRRGPGAGRRLGFLLHLILSPASSAVRRIAALVIDMAAAVGVSAFRRREAASWYPLYLVATLLRRAPARARRAAGGPAAARRRRLCRGRRDRPRSGSSSRAGRPG